ncbi:MAG: hypothetical protein ACJA1A_000717 [Saprospiraceae bacterium]|jgi:hypothetical protein
MKRKTTSLIVLLFLCTGLLAQSSKNNIIKNLEFQKALGFEMLPVDLLSSQPSITLENIKVEKEVSQAEFLSLNTSTFSKLKNSPIELIEITIPSQTHGDINLELYKTKIVSDDFKVFVASDRQNPYAYNLGTFYWGSVKGDDESIASISISSTGVSGFIHSKGETFVLGKLENEDNTYILYRERDLLIQNTVGCDVDDSKHLITKKIESAVRIEDPNNCVKMYIEVDNDIFNNKGTVQATTDYITDVFAQVAILYANESINFAVNEIVVWDVTDPYTGPSTSNYLDQFRANLGGTFNGDLAHLVGYQGSGGIAYVDVLCNSSFGVGYSDINSTFSVVPTYSWTVEVLTHEIGHNLGSRHTHNCVWNGNNTAIDRCGPAAGYDAETCNQNAPLPAKGTIMSYCHLVNGIGIDFNLGFGPQPGDLIRNRVYNAACLTACSAPTADDAGISSVVSPSGAVCDASSAPIVELTNYGSNSLNSVNINYALDGGSTSTYSWSGSLASGANTSVTLPSISYAIGSHTLNVDSSLPNGVTDEDNSNDANSSSFTRQQQQTYYQDLDNDSYGNPAVSVLDCSAPSGYVTDNTDCNDNNDQAYPGASCSDGDICTSGDILDAGCNCSGTFVDNDGDGVCDANDICEGGDDTIDTNGNGIPDFCDCNAATTVFGTNPLTHSGSGSTNTTKFFAANDKNVTFTISAMDSKLNGNPNNRFIDAVTISYVDGNGSSQSYGVFTGDVQNSVAVSISGMVQSVSVSLSNALNTNKSLSVSLSGIDYCSGTPPCSDADGDGVCDVDDVCPGFDDNLIGTSCSDNDVCTINDTYGVDCNCSGTYSDNDGDGVCDGNDICPGGDDTIDTDGDGIPDACDLDCTVTSSSFNINPLTHSGAGSSSTTLSFPAGNIDVSFTINELNAKTNGKPNKKYIDQVTVTYVDGSGGTVQEGVYSGNSTASASINISGAVQSVTLTLEDGFDGNSGSTVMSVSMTNVSSCVPTGSTISVSSIDAQALFYPNPAREILHVELDKIVEHAKVELFDIMGRMIYSKEMNKEQSLEISLRDLTFTQNVFFAIIKIDNESPKVEKIILLK